MTLLNTKKKQLEERLHRTATERHSRDTPKYVSDLVKLQEENVSPPPPPPPLRTGARSGLAVSPSGVSQLGVATGVLARRYIVP